MRVHFLPNTFEFREHITLWRRAVRHQQTIPWDIAIKWLRKDRPRVTN